MSNSVFQRGRPENSSASHHTVPASSASRSVADIGGSTDLNQPNRRLEINALRSGGKPSGTSTSMATALTTIAGQPAGMLNGGDQCGDGNQGSQPSRGAEPGQYGQEQDQCKDDESVMI
jgi:hypothetical protein